MPISPRCCARTRPILPSRRTFSPTRRNRGAALSAAGESALAGPLRPSQTKSPSFCGRVRPACSKSPERCRVPPSGTLLVAMMRFRNSARLSQGGRAASPCRCKGRASRSESIWR
jgi:hypothetical protein